MACQCPPSRALLLNYRIAASAASLPMPVTLALNNGSSDTKTNWSQVSHDSLHHSSWKGRMVIPSVDEDCDGNQFIIVRYRNRERLGKVGPSDGLTRWITLFVFLSSLGQIFRQPVCTATHGSPDPPYGQRHTRFKYYPVISLPGRLSTSFQ